MDYILIIEDNEFQLKKLGKHFKRKGYGVSLFSTGEKFENFINKVNNKKDEYKKCLCIIIDIDLPTIGKRGGIELVKKFREKFEEGDENKMTGHKPLIIFLTGYNFLPDDDFINKYKPIKRLTKPVTFGKLDKIIEVFRDE